MTSDAPAHIEGDAELLAKLFHPRSSPHGKLVSSDDQDATARSGLTIEDFRDHLAGRRRFGAIPFVDAEHVGCGAIDLDALHWGLDPDDPEVFSIINKIVETLAGYGLRTVVERSRRKGWHLWIFFDRPLSGRDVRVLLRRVALEAGAQDASDLVCPRQDRLEADGVGNGMWLPLFGGDHAPHTRFYKFDPDTGDWVVAADQEAVLRELIAHPSPAEGVPPAQANGPGSASSTTGDDEHPCAWIVEELREYGIELAGLTSGAGKIQFSCPFHVAQKTRARGGSAVMWGDGHGHCSSAKCNRKWKTLAEFVHLLGAKGRERLVLVPLDRVAPERVEWLWGGRIPRGKIGVLDGDPGLGKSTVMLDLAARVSTGRAMPDGSPGIDGSVVILSAEDGLADTIRPRLDAAGADLSRIVAVESVGERLVEFPEDVKRIEETIESIGAVLLIVDPLMAFLSGEVNAHRDQHVRRALAPLAKMAERSPTRPSIVVVRHLNKGSTTANPLHRGGGSIGIIGAARAGLLAARDPDDPERRVLALTKSNLGKPMPSIGFRVVTAENGAAAIEWLGFSTHSAERLLVVPENEEERSKLEDAKDVLREILASGPVASEEVVRQARATHVSERTLDRAKAALRVRSFRNGKIWFWELKRTEGCQRGQHA